MKNKCRWRLKALQLQKDFKHLQKVLFKIRSLAGFPHILLANWLHLQMNILPNLRFKESQIAGEWAQKSSISQSHFSPISPFGEGNVDESDKNEMAKFVAAAASSK